MDGDPQQLLDDRQYVLNLIQNDQQVIDPLAPERRASVVEILERLIPRGPRRGGPTKQELWSLQDLCPGEAQVNVTATKQAICEDLLRRLRDARPRDGQPFDRPRGDAPAGDAPAGWEGMVAPADRVTVHQFLLQKVRNELEGTEDEQLGSLLCEQDAVVAAQRCNHGPTLQFARANLQEMSANPAPLPANVTDEWVWYLYKTALSKMIDAISTSAAASQPRVRAAPAVADSELEDALAASASRPSEAERELARELAEETERASKDTDTTSSSDSDLASYAPRKSFSVDYGRKKKRKAKKKRKKRKKRKKKVTSSEESAENEDEDEPNGRRVSATAYNSTHLERMQEFRDAYREYKEDSEPGSMPDAEAIDFIARKFARPGTKFAHPKKGVLAKFVTKDQKDHANKRVHTIYAMADEAAELRIERNEKLAQAHRRAAGKSEAKAARIKQAASKFKSASVREEQTLIARIGVYCDLVLMGRQAWEAYHHKLKLGGQTQAIVESTGGLAKAKAANAAWKAAEAAAVKDVAPKLPQKRVKKCYWCMGNHQGSKCPKLNAGEPHSPGSRAAKWPPADREKLRKRRCPGVRISRD